MDELESKRGIFRRCIGFLDGSNIILRYKPLVYFQPDEYILAVKAYTLERYIITPYKAPAARLPINVVFNYGLSKP